MVDVFWINTKYRGHCSECGQFIDVGDTILLSRDIETRDGRFWATFCDESCLVSFCDLRRIAYRIRSDFNRVYRRSVRS